METKIYRISAIDDECLKNAEMFRDKEDLRLIAEQMQYIEQAGAALAAGALVAFPTETVYGIGADAFNEDAVRRVYAAKGRPSDNPMIVHIARASDAGLLAKKLTPDFVRLADAFWPGPLTIIMEKTSDVPRAVTGGLDTVAIRLPDHPAARELIRAAAVPVAAPSANLSGSPSPTSAEHVIRDLNGRVDIILAGGICKLGIESTVIDLTCDTPTVLRPGQLGAEELSAVLEKEVLYDAPLLANRQDVSQDLEPRAPGMKYKHYAPKAQMLVVEGAAEKVKAEVYRLKERNESIGCKVEVLLFSEKNYQDSAHDLYAQIREADAAQPDLIIAGALSEAYSDGVGFALMNRMLKAAGHKVVRLP